MKSILFVCLGNICRSPLADGIANKIARDYKLDLYIDSAGTSQWHIGEAPCQNSIKIAKQNGIDISGLKARTLHRHDSQTFEYIVAMDKQNKKDLISLGYENVYLIGEYGGFNGLDVPDPYFFPGFEGFEKVYEMLDLSIKDFLVKEKLWQ